MRLRWPWIAVGRLDDALAAAERAITRADLEIAWLRERVEFLEDRQERRQRKELGMLEEPRKPRVERQDMPVELVQYINRWASKSLRHEQLRAAFRRNNDGESWDTIKADIMREEANAQG